MTPPPRRLTLYPPPFATLLPPTPLASPAARTLTIWKRRSLLTPDAVHYLVEELMDRVSETNIEVESCDQRVLPDANYAKVRLPFTSPLFHVIYA